MRKFRRRKRFFVYVRNRKNLKFIWVLFIITLFGILIIAGDLKIRPIVRDMALARVKYIATKAMNDAISEQISKDENLYSEIISLEKDNNQKITALRTNMIKINSIKAEVINSVLEKIGKLDTSQLGIPIGNIINGELFSGRGPRIPIKIVPVGSANATFLSVFSSAGINQTRHQIIMEATVNISVLLPGSNMETDIKTQMNIAETVLVGNVPNSYTYIDDTRSSTLDKMIDYTQ